MCVRRSPYKIPALDLPNSLDYTRTCMVYKNPRSAPCPHPLRSFTRSDPSTYFPTWDSHFWLSVSAAPRPPSIFIPSVFINLQIPRPATPVFSHLYKTPGVRGSPPLVFPNGTFRLSNHPVRFQTF